MNFYSIFIFRAIFFLVTVFLSEGQNQSRMNSTSSTFKHDIDQLQLHEVNYVWTIDKPYLNVRFRDNHTLYSPTFSRNPDHGFKWYLKLNLYKEVDGKKFDIYVILSPESEKSKAWATKLDIDFWSDEQRTANLWHARTDDEKITEFNYHNDGWGYPDKKLNDTFFSINKLIISCKLKYCVDAPAFSYPRQRTKTTHQSNATNSKSSFGNSASLFNNSRLADVVLLVNGSQYPAHKTILAIHSPVFAAKFERSAKKGKRLNRVNITNMNEKVAGEMLRYIYTGKCENLDTISDQLFVAADKYGLDELKLVCEESLWKMLTVENAAKTLQLADKHGGSDLRKKTIGFIFDKFKEVSNTTDWKRIAKTKPKLVHDVLHHAAGL